MVEIAEGRLAGDVPVDAIGGAPDVSVVEDNQPPDDDPSKRVLWLAKRIVADHGRECGN